LQFDQAICVRTKSVCWATSNILQRTPLLDVLNFLIIDSTKNNRVYRKKPHPIPCCRSAHYSDQKPWSFSNSLLLNGAGCVIRVTGFIRSHKIPMLSNLNSNSRVASFATMTKPRNCATDCCCSGYNQGAFYWTHLSKYVFG
jgi:hypothetical protein